MEEISRKTHEWWICESVKENDKEIKKSHNHTGKYYDFVFLCGGKKQENDNRSLIAKYLEGRDRTVSIYSEDLFSLLKDIDLLTFEEILFEISTRVIIIVESWGSACELGAFSYLNENIEKLLVINDKEHECENSFINQGPIRKLKEYDSDKIFFEKFKEKKLIISNALGNAIVTFDPCITFKQKTYENDLSSDILMINDISYLLWLIFDIIKMFGSLNKNNTYWLIKKIFGKDKIHIKLKSGNLIDDQEKIKKIICFFFVVLNRAEIINTDDEEVNYRINLEFLKKKHINLTSFSNLLFNKKFMTTRNAIKMRAKVINKSKKRGCFFWKI